MTISQNRAASLAMQDFLQATARQFAADEGRYPTGEELYLLGLFADWLDERYRLEAVSDPNYMKDEQAQKSK